MKLKRFTILLTIILLCVIAFVAIWQYMSPKLKPQAQITYVASSLQPSKALQKFSLTDTNGNNFTEKSLRGHWTLLFFGYTKCPGICPSTLATVRDAWQQFKQQNKVPARFVFADISNEPVETSELKLFLSNYNQEFLGVNGAQPDMQELSDQLGIYSQIQEDIIDHTASLILINPQAKLCAIFTPPFSAQDIVHDLQVLTHN